MSELTVNTNGDVIISGERIPTFGHFKEPYTFNLSEHFREIVMGLNRNLDHDQFYTEVVSVKQYRESLK